MTRPRTGARRLPWRLIGTFAALVACATAVHDASGAKLTEIFPELESRMNQPGHVTLMLDGTEILDVMGDVEEVRFGGGRRLAAEALSRYRALLEARGFLVDRARVMSMGGVLGQRRAYRACAAEDSGLVSGTLPELRRAPFEVDSILAGHPALLDAWTNLLSRIDHYYRKKGNPPAYFPEPITLGDSLEAPLLAVVTASCWDLPAGKKMAKALFGGLVTGEDPRYPVPRTAIGFSLLDARTGQVLWDDFAVVPKPWSTAVLDETAAKMKAALP